MVPIQPQFVHTPKQRFEVVAIVATSMGMINKLDDALRVVLEAAFEALMT